MNDPSAFGAVHLISNLLQLKNGAKLFMNSQHPYSNNLKILNIALKSGILQAVRERGLEILRSQ